MLDVESIRDDFPILGIKANGRPLVYLDNAATMQMPLPVRQALQYHYEQVNANVHRGTHYLSHESTKAYEEARETAVRFLNAPSQRNIVFSTGTTGAINTVALGLRDYVQRGDIVVATVLEHHSNFVPWQQLCLEKGAQFKVVGIDQKGDLDLDELKRVVTGGAKIVACTCCSNVLGAVTPVHDVVKIAHEAGALCLLDAAQGIRHGVLDVQELDCDFLAFSGHKLGAPTGIGVLYGKSKALELLKPAWFGGEMVDIVTTEKTTWEELPLRLEPGTPNYVGAIGLGAALGYLEFVGRKEASAYEDELIAYAVKRLSEIDGMHIYGDPIHRSGCVSFNVEGVHPFDLCTLIDKMGVALRSGNACAQPLLSALGCTAVARLSPAFYNSFEEIDAAVSTINRGALMLRN
ncbi:SufS family cysteine desulfurase [Eggerthellaceae bacterium zg-887]|uniref:SufS family cysteine desulfurase n=1 Tax=Xiamenia xianingshaonis TaxID=2682776 RepID=UPI001409306E|nr:SufS family cysteine desulfurase [Xiamenia xianingshaonis]NHM16987.1 SufS family cysteine desulfurase [Xiamenia xianingshaonis]